MDVEHFNLASAFLHTRHGLPSHEPENEADANMNVPIPVLPKNDGRARAKENADHVSFCLGADTEVSVFGLRNVAIIIDTPNSSNNIYHQVHGGKPEGIISSLRSFEVFIDIHKTKQARRLVGLVACQHLGLVKACLSGLIVKTQTQRRKILLQCDDMLYEGPAISFEGMPIVGNGSLRTVRSLPLGFAPKQSLSLGPTSRFLHRVYETPRRRHALRDTLVTCY
jgi:hypothetical protein